MRSSSLGETAMSRGMSLFWIWPLAAAITASSCPSRIWTNSRCWTTSLSGRGAWTTTVRWLSSRSIRVVRCMTSGTSPPAGARRSRISSFSPAVRLRTRSNIST